MSTPGAFVNDLDAMRIPLDVSPIDPACTRAALRHLVGAYAATHHRLPSARAVADIWRMLSAAPRPEVPASVLRARGLPDDRQRPFEQ